MRTQTLGNEYNLREVTTAYRTDIINEAAKDGKPFFIREVKINPELQTTSLLLKGASYWRIYTCTIKTFLYFKLYPTV
jgi:hypothetical protein